MREETLVAVYRSRSDAETVRERLLGAGIPEADIGLSAEETGAASMPGETETAAPRGFFDWLFGSHVPEEDQARYREGLREGRTALSVRVRDETQRNAAADILEALSPIDIEEKEAAEPMAETEVVLAAAAETVGTGAVPQPEAAPQPAAAQEGEAIPAVKEEPEVAEKAAERRYRFRSYVAEHPVEQPVQLHEEKAVIEPGPVTETAAAAAGTPQERESEVVEHHVEPVAEKLAAAGEAGVHKIEQHAVETVQDTAREIKADVQPEAVENVLDKAAAGDKPSAAAGASPVPEETSIAHGKEQLKEEEKGAVHPEK
jgi:hypothetical protein